MAERVGFEPTVPCGTPHFECGTFDRTLPPLRIQFQINFPQEFHFKSKRMFGFGDYKEKNPLLSASNHRAILKISGKNRQIIAI